MNTNLIHNLLNGAMAIVAVLSVPEIVALIPPQYAVMILGAAATAKTIINVVRDGLSGLTKSQPPVS